MPSFRELADGLPRVSTDTPIVPLPVGITRPAEADSAFVEPTLTLREGEISSAQAVLVAAPAAVGKTTFAAALAADRGSLLWNLGEFPVGSGSFLGKLTEAHGIGALARVTDAFSNGEYSVVLDALDEGYSLSRSDNFEAFVSDLAKQTTQLSPRRPAIIACGRTDTIDLTNLLLQDAGLDTCVLTLDFFSMEAAREFVDVHLDKAGHTAHRQFRGPFEEGRDFLFERISAAVGAEDDAGGMDAPSFLGYAPVLVALARYLRLGNYQTLVRELSNGSLAEAEGRGLWALLRRVVVDLLIREKPKLIEHLPAPVRAAISDADISRLYSPAEQCERLLARAAASPPPAADVPADVLPEYEKSVTETLGEHPFVGTGPEGFASVVFRDYVLAQALSSPADSGTARDLARRRGFKPSPLLVRFVVDAAEARGQVIDVDDIDLLYASAHAEEVGDARARLTVEQTESGLSVEVVTARGELFEFVASRSQDARIEIGGRLAHSDINTPDWTLVLGRAGAEVVVGPDVTISCDAIIVSAASLRIEARDADEAVVWDANSVAHEAGEFQLSNALRDQFRLTLSTQPGYPWTGFTSARIIDGGGDPAIDGALRELKKLATRFKPGVVAGTGPTIPVKIIDVLAARDRVSRALYSYATDTGLITVSGKDAYLHPQQFGLNIVDIRERRATPAAQAYLADYVRSREADPKV